MKEKIKEIFTKEVGKPKEGYSEKQLEHFSRVAFQGSIIGFFLAWIGFIIQILVFTYANRALKSSNTDTIKRAKSAKKIAGVYLLFFVLVNIYLSFLVLFSN
ncbi:hypothetical protein KAS79_00500 [Candidatus Parcubacteria bacterium]|nr:hypothetical protein [Candidatus Parcubacteria bacterium]